MYQGKRKQLDPVTISILLHKEATVLGSQFRKTVINSKQHLFLIQNYVIKTQAQERRYFGLQASEISKSSPLKATRNLKIFDKTSHFHNQRHKTTGEAFMCFKNCSISGNNSENPWCSSLGLPSSPLPFSSISVTLRTRSCRDRRLTPLSAEDDAGPQKYDH